MKLLVSTKLRPLFEIFLIFVCLIYMLWRVFNSFIYAKELLIVVNCSQMIGEAWNSMRRKPALSLLRSQISLECTLSITTDASRMLMTCLYFLFPVSNNFISLQSMVG